MIAKYLKRADKEKNRIIIPKFIIDKYGREFYLEIYEDGTMKLTPKKGDWERRWKKVLYYTIPFMNQLKH